MPAVSPRASPTCWPLQLQLPPVVGNYETVRGHVEAEPAGQSAPLGFAEPRHPEPDGPTARAEVEVAVIVEVNRPPTCPPKAGEHWCPLRAEDRIEDGSIGST